ncbi:HpcH/HpaI aldolase family protein [Subtercola sp. RTI3]|uniref:HpcH/HpaI aldolase family protein n=1 Tax=Subtercola sp. RTI3 TaxID=3048639 RepID=UPI002B237EA8|nr:aldolase/citrate lyase family protein [Subtercola sp. RTI3]MEA9984234.1 aldolase/citrate lyase family protein [Subtercola sp. RTI3]
MTSGSLRARAESGERLLGVLVRIPAEELVEMAAVAGFDFVLVDCEHGPADVVALRQHIAVAAIHRVPVVVRVGENDPGMILRALDQGAEGIVGPHVDNAADAEALVAAAHYPPIGTRGFATYSRAGRFGETDPTGHRDWYHANTLVIGMIESPAAVAEADAIVATSGLDGVMIGPADLAASSGTHDLPVAEAIKCVNTAISSGGVLRMDIVSSVEAANAAFEQGAQLVVYNLAASLMTHLIGLLTPRN